jgi:predicted GNAT family acetyltransferase
MIIESIRSMGDEVGVRAARHMDIAFRSVMTGPGSEQNADWFRLITGEAHPMGNVALISTADDLDAALAATAPLVSCGAPAAAIFTSGVSRTVSDAVKAQGFATEASMPAMAVDIDTMRPTALPPGYEWARIGGGEEGCAWARALAVGYELPQPLADLFAPEAVGVDMASDAPIQFFAVLRNGRQVATSMLYLADGLAGIYCVSTLPEERQKGLGAHATAEALRIARRLGYRVGVLQSSRAGHPVYLGLGFGDYAQVPMLIRMPG